MSDPADGPSYRRYDPPDQPVPEREPTYRVYDAPADSAVAGEDVAPVTARPVPTSPVATSRRPVVAAVVVTLALFVMIAIGGVLLLGTSSPGVVETSTGTISTDDGRIRADLEKLRERYSAARKAGELSTVGLTDDEFDDTAVVAFTFLLTDMILATQFGISDDEAADYARQAAAYERLLLAGEPLGDDIEITFSEERAFRYDGATGEGGFVDPSTGG